MHCRTAWQSASRSRLAHDEPRLPQNRIDAGAANGTKPSLDGEPSSPPFPENAAKRSFSEG